MASLNQTTQIIERILSELVEHYHTSDSPRVLTAFDHQNGQFLLIDEGWQGYRRIHTIWAHVEQKDDKLWIHEDGTEEGIANLLVQAGIPKEKIVLAFDAPQLRSLSEFATT